MIVQIPTENSVGKSKDYGSGDNPSTHPDFDGFVNGGRIVQWIR
jgi:hypothetical protein